MTRLLRLLGVVAAGLLLTVVAASPAHALLGGPDAPPAESPGGGAVGFFGLAPDDPPDDPEGGAWVDGAPMYSHYGTAGLRLNTYDLGTGPDVANEPGGVIGTTIGNWLFAFAEFFIAATGGLLGAAYQPTYLATFDPLLVDATEALQSAIYNQWAPVALGVVGLVIMWRSRSGKWAQTTLAVVWALFVMIVASAVFTWPVQAGSIADESIGAVVGSVNRGINGTSDGSEPVDEAIGAVSNAVLFEQWKMGTFGSADSATAHKYAKAIYTGQALTWQEAARVAADPEGDGADLLEAKAEQWQEAAEAIESEDPDAYAHLTGRNGENRVLAGFLAVFTAVLITPFLIASALLMIGAYLVIRFAVVFFPLIATIGLVYSMRGAVKGVGLVVAAAVVNSIVFGVGAAVAVLGLRTILGTDMPLWLKMTLAGVFMFVLWVALRPARKLTSMVSPNRMFTDAAGAIGSTVDTAKEHGVRLATAAGAAYTGNLAALATMSRAADESLDPKVPRAEAQPDTIHAESVDVSTPPPGPPPAPVSAVAEPVRPALAAAPTVAPAAAALPPGIATPMPGGPTPATATSGAPFSTDRWVVGESGSVEGHWDERNGVGWVGSRDFTDHDEWKAAATGPATGDGSPPVFVPAEQPTRTLGDPTLPVSAEAVLDEDTGDEVYTLFVPDEDEAEAR